VPAAVAVLAAVTVGAGLGLPGRPAPVLAVTVTGLLAMTVSAGWLLTGPPAAARCSRR
jgi:hypothetical protein